MAYEPDEENNWGAIVERAFCFKGEGYSPGQWFYGTQEEITELYRVGVFHQDVPRWLREQQLNAGGGVIWYVYEENVADRPTKYARPGALTLATNGATWDAVFREQFHVFN